MTVNERIRDFAKLGEILANLGANHDWPGLPIGLTEQEWTDLQEMIRTIKIHNGWFTEESVRSALSAWGELLKENELEQWTNAYNRLEWSDSVVAVIMAGNIPIVGFHDMLSVLISGKKLMAKPSTDDTLLMKAIAFILIKLNPIWDERIIWADGRLGDFQAVIATGSNNSARYFEQYFGHVPHIIRKNRSGIAILYGTESEDELELLGKDVFSYFGLGCRNVSKAYVPMDFDLDRIFKGLYPYREIVNHNKYANNYDYHKAIYLLNEDAILENGFLLLKEHNEQIASPVATLLYERYEDETKLRTSLSERADEIQCIISQKDLKFGMSQSPGLSDYADGVDTLAFLAEMT